MVIWQHLDAIDSHAPVLGFQRPGRTDDPSASETLTAPPDRNQGLFRICGPARPSSLTMYVHLGADGIKTYTGSDPT